MTGVSTSCGACKFLRRKCTIECVFAPYFSYDEAVAHFAAVHKVFGASNVSRLLLHLPEHFRGEAALTISFEAIARMRDPVYGCVAYIHALQQEVASLQEEIEVIGNQMVNTMSIGITSDCEGSQATNNNLLTYDTSSPLLLCSQEYEIINNLPEEWNTTSTNYQVEPVIHADNNGSSCSTQMMFNNHMINLLPGQNNLFGNGYGPQECLLEGLINLETFDNSSLFGCLSHTPSIQ
ncbi:LOB domain-containing protein 33-like [Chenopodium quinoa]|uniref:LOB domain-containing protein 33-like n=1 Tax=Chenopodium quinoa TaxID=63459 RepID=UPI000B799836|nr:LOB domain-containing protein 33-like [Chenopodium quinoa]